MSVLGLQDVGSLASFDVVLTPTNAEAADVNRALALSGGMLSCLVCSTSTWVDRLWELAGDGRGFVGDVTRIVAMAISLDGREGLTGPHLPTLLAQRMRDAAGSPALAVALDAVREGVEPEGLLPSEVELLRALAAYEDELDVLGLVEEGAAIAYLTGHLSEAFPQPSRVAVVGTAPLDFRLQALVDAAVEAGLIELTYLEESGATLSRAPESISLRFAFPSGRYATPQLVLKVVDELSADGPMLISSNSSAELYKKLAPALSRRGFKVAMRGAVSLARTQLGRLAIALVRTLASAEPPWDKASLIDALSNPLVKLNPRMRTRLDALLRENRLLITVEGLERVPNSAVIAPLLTFIHEPTLSSLAAVRKALAEFAVPNQPGRDELFGTLDVFEDIVRTYAALEKKLDSFGYILMGPLGKGGLGVRCANAKLAPGEPVDILIEDMSQAATAPVNTFATALVLDLDEENYPAARKNGAIDLLMARLGVPAPEMSIERQRRQLAALTAIPTKTLILGRCLTDAKAEPTYPAAVLEEFVDLYREDVTLADDIDNIYALPEQLQAGLITCGEDALEADVVPGAARADCFAPHEPAHEAVFAPGTAPDGSPTLPRLSPAQIEAYLECPAKWLYCRRLGTGALDEQMSPRELGIFRHDSLQHFYELFRKEGHAKVSSENLEQAKTVLKIAMGDVMKDYLELDEDGRPVRALNRCVAPPGSSDARTIWRVHTELLDWLPYEAAFLPGPSDGTGSSPFAYAPRAFELSLDDFNVTFAGVQLTGRIDRVDVSLDGSSFVVVDYKGSLTTKYTPELNDGELVLPAKVQALIYAAAIARTPALREALGITCAGTDAIAGAIYASYMPGYAVRGTYTDKLTRERHLPTLPSKTNPLTADEMAKLIDEIERVVATKVVEPLLAGKVDPLPIGDACKYCPAEGCPRKKVV